MEKISIWKRVSVEPVMFLYMLAYMSTSVVEEQLFVDKACRINLHLGDAICDRINDSNNTIHKKQVQLVVSNFRQYESIALNAVPTLLALLLGAWSDRHGRKWPMLLGLVGSVFYSVMVVVNVIKGWRLEMVLYTASFPSALTGSGLAIFLAAFTYMADITTAEQRTLRITLLEVAYLIPMPTGVAIGSFLFTKVFNKSFIIMFSIRSLLMAVALLYASLSMETKSSNLSSSADENISTMQNNGNDVKWCCLCDIWDARIIVDSFRTVFRKRPDNRRSLLIMVLLSMGFYTFQRDERHMVFLYTQLKYHWNFIQYSQFRTFQSSFYVLGLLVGVPMMTKLLSLPDTVVIMVGSLAHCLARLLFATAQQPSLFFIGAAISAFGPVVAPVLRSITSKLVPPSERGKAYSMFTVADSCVPLVSAAIYSQTYNRTINTAPAAFFLVTVISQIIVFLLSLTMHVSLSGKGIEQAEDTKMLEAEPPDWLVSSDLDDWGRCSNSNSCRDDERHRRT